MATVSDVLSYDNDIAPYKLVKIFSGVGSGKSSFACNLITGNKVPGIPKKKVLLITSRRSTVEETLNRMGDEVASRVSGRGNLSEEVYQTRESAPIEYEQYATIIQDQSDEWFKETLIYNKSTVCTNAHIEKYFRYSYEPGDASTHVWNQFDVIIVDEIHSIVTDATFQSAPFYVLRMINEMLRRWTEGEFIRAESLILMTGTPAPLEYLQIYDFDTARTITYDLFSRCHNVVPQEIILLNEDSARVRLNQICKDGGKSIYFGSHSFSIEGARSLLHLSKDVKIVTSYTAQGKNIDTIEAERIKAVNDYIAHFNKIPDCHVFVTTSRNREGINITNDDIENVFVESHISSEVVQMAGRLRCGAKRLFIIFDAPQLGYPPNDIAIDFICPEIVSKKNAEDCCGYANSFLTNFCRKEGLDGIALNSRSERIVKRDTNGRVQSLIAFVEKAFSYVHYDYLTNSFMYYAQKEQSELYVNAEKVRFTDAVTAGDSQIEHLVRGWFPTVPKISHALTLDDQCKMYISKLLGRNCFLLLDTDQYQEICQTLSTIYGTNVKSPNIKLKPIHFFINDRNRQGYYCLHRGSEHVPLSQMRNPAKRSPRK